VLILNTHSVLNTGDLAITLAEIQLLRRGFPDQEIAITSRTPDIDHPYFSSLGIRLFPPLSPAPSIFDGKTRKGIEILKNVGALRSKMGLVRQIKASDLVISSGGGYFWSNRRFFPGPMFFQNYLHLKLATILRKPVILFPQSFGPFYNRPAFGLLRNLLESDAVVSIFARERTSQELLNGLLRDIDARAKVDSCPDIAFCLDALDGSEKPSLRLDLPKPVVAVTVRDWDFPETKSEPEKRKKRDEYLGSLVSACSRIFQRHRGSFVVFAQARGPGRFENDVAISREFTDLLTKSLPETNVRSIPLKACVSPELIINILSLADLLLATRFHSAIFAFLAGTPAISISYQPKSNGIMNSLGLGEFCLDIANIDSDRIVHLADHILCDHVTIRNKLMDDVAQLKRTAEDTLNRAMTMALHRGE